MQTGCECVDLTLRCYLLERWPNVAAQVSTLTMVPPKVTQFCKSVSSSPRAGDFVIARVFLFVKTSSSQFGNSSGQFEVKNFHMFYYNGLERRVKGVMLGPQFRVSHQYVSHKRTNLLQ